jgi:hypothetical protein
VYEQLGRPSSQTQRKRSAIMAGERPADSWKNKVAADRVKRVLEILSWFGLDAVYGEAAMPDAQAAYAMLRAE